jgi:putative hydrolase of the HAD superfamily
MPPTNPIHAIAFDADDTLWENETFFHLTQERFTTLLADYADKDHLAERLLAAERRNIGHYGFGVKGFVLSMIETALDVTDDKLPNHVIRNLLEAGQDMLNHPVHLLPGVAQTLDTLSYDYDFYLITKGDLLHQERKLAQSNLAALFEGVEIVSDKNTQTYRSIFTKYGLDPARVVMVGNSLKSDILPAIEAGAWGVFVPYHLSWGLEHAQEPENESRYGRIESLSDLPAYLDHLHQGLS